MSGTRRAYILINNNSENIILGAYSSRKLAEKARECFETEYDKRPVKLSIVQTEFNPKYSTSTSMYVAKIKFESEFIYNLVDEELVDKYYQDLDDRDLIYCGNQFFVFIRVRNTSHSIDKIKQLSRKIAYDEFSKSYNKLLLLFESSTITPSVKIFDDKLYFKLDTTHSEVENSNRKVELIYDKIINNFTSELSYFLEPLLDKYNKMYVIDRSDLSSTIIDEINVILRRLLHNYSNNLVIPIVSYVTNNNKNFIYKNRKDLYYDKVS